MTRTPELDAIVGTRVEVLASAVDAAGRPVSAAGLTARYGRLVEGAPVVSAEADVTVDRDGIASFSFLVDQAGMWAYQVTLATEPHEVVEDGYVRVRRGALDA